VRQQLRAHPPCQRVTDLPDPAQTADLGRLDQLGGVTVEGGGELCVVADNGRRGGPVGL
jgi:hypothetical protein